MNLRLRVSRAVLLALFICPPLFAGNGSGGGGGHGGHGGGGGGHAGGHFAGGGSSGHSFGHSIGHSLGHLFGHRSGGRDSRIGKKPGSNGDVFVSGVAAGFAGGHARRRTLLRNRRFFNSGYCGSYRFSWHNFLFPGEFDCFGGAFYSAPFLYGGALGTYFWSDSLAASQNFGEFPEQPTSLDEPETAPPSLWNVEEPIALLQLLDGSTYGILRYWVEGTALHYVTNYGGENSVPLERIDFAGTAKLNAANGSRFDITANTHNQ